MTTQWKIADSLKDISGDTPTQTTIRVESTSNNISETYFTFYYSYMQTMYGEIVTYNGYYIMVAAALEWDNSSSTSKITQLQNKDDNGYYHLCYSSDGKNWTYSTSTFCQSTSPGNKIYQGASTAKLILRDGTENTVDFIYSVQDNYDGGQDIGRVMYRQTGTITITNGVPTLNGFPTDSNSNNGRPDISTLFMKPDDVNYSSYNTNNSCYFENPNFYIIEDNMYCLFNASISYGGGTTQINDSSKGFPITGYTPETNNNEYCGCIGLASIPLSTFKTGTYLYSDWTFYPPLITTIGVTARPYMPSLVIEGDNTYIFFNSEATNTIPSSLYGFVSYNGLMGDYFPMNGSGSVLKNPSASLSQTSSWTVDSSFRARGIILEIVDSNNDTVVIGSPSPLYHLIVNGEMSYTSKVGDYGISSAREWADIYNSDTGPI